MGTKTTSGTKQNTAIFILIAFTMGFLAGIVFAVFKLTPSDPSAVPPPVAQQQSQQENQAMLNLEAKVTTNPNDREAWLHLGHLYFDSNQPQKAISAYNTALELGEGDANLLTDIGVMYRRTDQPSKALELFDQAIALDPAHQYSRLNKGIVLLYDLNKTEEAFAAWEELLKINPDMKLADNTSLAKAMEQMKKDLANQK